MAIDAHTARHNAHFVRRGLRRARRIEGNDDAGEVGDLGWQQCGYGRGGPWSKEPQEFRLCP